jgi:hypothetical protein
MRFVNGYNLPGVGIVGQNSDFNVLLSELSDDAVWTEHLKT